MRMHSTLEAKRPEIEALCRRYRVSRLEVFGSLTRDADYDPARSDIDLIVEFAPQAAPRLETYFALRDALAELLGRPVDLLMQGAVANPFALMDIDRTRQLVYAA